MGTLAHELEKAVSAYRKAHTADPRLRDATTKFELRKLERRIDFLISALMTQREDGKAPGRGEACTESPDGFTV